MYAFVLWVDRHTKHVRSHSRVLLTSLLFSLLLFYYHSNHLQSSRVYTRVYWPSLSALIPNPRAQNPPQTTNQVIRTYTQECKCINDAMSTDREVLRVVWEGQIPVCFQVDPDEIDGVQQPENFYLMISRLSYLPLVTEKVCALRPSDGTMETN